MIVLINEFLIISVTSGPVDGESNEGGSDTILSSTKLYIVIGCIAALVFIALLQAGCTIYRTSRGSAPNTKVINFSRK